MIVNNHVVHGVLQLAAPLDHRPCGCNVSVHYTQSRPSKFKTGVLHHFIEVSKPRNHSMTLCRAQISENYVGARFQRDSQQLVVCPALQRRKFVRFGKQCLEAPLCFIVGVHIKQVSGVSSARVPLRQCGHDGRLSHAALAGDRKDDTLGFQFQGRGQSSLLPTKTLGLKTFVGCNRDSLWRSTSASRSSLAISSSLRTCHAGFSFFSMFSLLRPLARTVC